jgi:hypothetical protein
MPKRSNTYTKNNNGYEPPQKRGFTNFEITKFVFKLVKANAKKQKQNELPIFFIGGDPFLRYSFTHYDAFAMGNTLIGASSFMPYLRRLYYYLLTTYPESRFEISVVKQFIVNYYENL